jgi:hypothetical protein
MTETTTTNPTDEATRLREEAAQHERDAHESFERCDTDGFVSQWASGINAQLKAAQASLVEAGGVATFPALVDAETGEWVPSKLINGKYGTSWAILDEHGKFTGKFVSAFPARESTMLRKGYRETEGLWPANARLAGSGRGLSGNVWVQHYKTCDDLTPPIELVDDEA